MARPLTSYAVIGNTRTTALVAADGSIERWCLPRHDGPAMLTRFLDEGGPVCGNELGLFAKEIDCGSGEQGGNLPQAFTRMCIIDHAIRAGEAHAGRMKCMKEKRREDLPRCRRPCPRSGKCRRTDPRAGG